MKLLAKFFGIQFIQLIRKWHFVSALLVFLPVLILFGYINLINTPPQSTHLWRQSDCTSLALNYYQDGMIFFKPEIHNLHADGGTTGYAISEFPILYYLVAGLYKIFGLNIWVYRGLWTIILILGFVAIYRLFLFYSNLKFISLIGSLLIYTSPVLIFYGNSFLPDMPALAFTLMGWMFFAKWLKEERYYYLWIVAFFFMLGGVLKITALISFFSLAGVWFLEFFGLKIGEERKVFSNKLKSLFPFLLTFAFVVGWYLWAWNYNKIHNTNYFLMRTCPIWSLSTCSFFSINDVIQQVKTLWLPHLFNKPMQIILLSSIIFLIGSLKYANRFLLVITLFMLIGSISYALLFFSFFHNHDYYIINLYIFPIFLLLTTLNTLEKRFNKFSHSPYLLFLLVPLALYSLYYTHSKQILRYKGWMNHEHSEFSDTRKVAPLLNSLKIEPKDRIISIPDRTPNYTLYILNRKGWTSMEGQVKDSLRMVDRISKGAKFLFVNDFFNIIEKRKYLKPYTTNLVGNYNSLYIFRIDGQSHSVRLIQEIDTLLNFRCDADVIVEGSNNLMESTNSNYSIKGAESRTKEISLSGDYSLFLNREQQFGFTTKIPVKPNNNVLVSVWRRSSSGAGYLVISGIDTSRLYVTSNKGVVDSESGWENITISLSISEGFLPEELVIYAYNPYEEGAYFDNFEVLVTESKYVISNVSPVL